MRTSRTTLPLLIASLVLGLSPAISMAVPDELTDELETAEERLADLDARLSAAVEDVNEATAELELLEAELSDTRRVVDELGAEVADIEDRTAGFLRSLYIRGPAMEFETALSAEGLAEASRGLAMLNRLSRDRQVELEQLAVRRTQLADAEDRLRAQVAAAERRSADVTDAKQRLESMLTEQQGTVTALQDRIAEIRAQEEAERQRRLAEQRRREAEERREAEAAAAAAAAAETPARQTPPEPPPPPPGTRRGADAAVQAALAQVGKPYRWAGSGPDSFDCSGLTSWGWRHAGVSLPHSSRMQYGATTRIARSDLRPGDLIFFGSPIHHVAMYIGNGDVVEAPYTGANVRVNGRALGRSDIAGYGRV